MAFRIGLTPASAIVTEVSHATGSAVAESELSGMVVDRLVDTEIVYYTAVSRDILEF